MGTATTVLMVDDHAVVREGYRRLLEGSGEVVVIGEARDAVEAYKKFTELAPQVVVMDISLPGASGIEALRRIRARDNAARVLMFSMYEDAIFARRSLDAGALGYITKASAPHVLVSAVCTVARNEQYLSADIARLLEQKSNATQLANAQLLSPREHEVLRLWLLGQTLSKIAASLDLSEKTIANLQSSIKQKLGAASAAELRTIAVKLGLSPETIMPEGFMREDGV